MFKITASNGHTVLRFWAKDALYVAFNFVYGGVSNHPQGDKKFDELEDALLHTGTARLDTLNRYAVITTE